MRRRGGRRILNRPPPPETADVRPRRSTTLALGAAVLAPALPARTDWVGETVFTKKPGIAYGKVEPDGTFTPVATLRSIQYVVVRDEKGRLQVTQDGKPVWVNKDEMVRLKDAVEHYTKMLDAEPNNDTWYAFRGWARHKDGKTAEGLKDYAEAIRLKPTAASWYSNRGLIHMEAKQVDDAIADFSSAIDLMPGQRGAVPEPGHGVLAQEGLGEGGRGLRQGGRDQPGVGGRAERAGLAPRDGPGRQGAGRQAGPGGGQEGVRADRAQERRIPGHAGRRLRRGGRVRQGGRVAGEGA